MLHLLNQRMIRKIRGYIFDLDHTLLNSDRVQIEAALWGFAQQGYTHTYEEVLAHFDLATDEMLRIVGENTFHGDFKLLERQSTDYLIKHIADIPLYPHVQELLAAVHASGGKIGFASNNYCSVIQAIIDTFGWSKWCQGFSGIEDVAPQERKPHPAMITRTAKILGCEPADCVMIGDSQYDIRAGKAAGTATIAVCTGTTPITTFQEIHPNWIVKRVGDLLTQIPLTFNKLNTPWVK
jgi:HAD superfamily hydrolase (TIGR01509 family)